MIKLFPNYEEIKLTEDKDSEKDNYEWYKGVVFDPKTNEFKVVSGQFRDKKDFYEKLTKRGYIVRKGYELVVWDWIQKNAKTPLDAYLMCSTAFSKWKSNNLLGDYYVKILNDIPELNREKLKGNPNTRSNDRYKPESVITEGEVSDFLKALPKEDLDMIKSYLNNNLNATGITKKAKEEIQNLINSLGTSDLDTPVENKMAQAMRNIEELGYSTKANEKGTNLIRALKSELDKKNTLDNGVFNKVNEWVPENELISQYGLDKDLASVILQNYYDRLWDTTREYIDDYIRKEDIGLGNDEDNRGFVINKSILTDFLNFAREKDGIDDDVVSRSQKLHVYPLALDVVRDENGKNRSVDEILSSGIMAEVNPIEIVTDANLDKLGTMTAQPEDFVRQMYDIASNDNTYAPAYLLMTDRGQNATKVTNAEIKKATHRLTNAVEPINTLDDILPEEIVNQQAIYNSNLDQKLKSYLIGIYRKLYDTKYSEEQRNKIKNLTKEFSKINHLTHDLGYNKAYSDENLKTGAKLKAIKDELTSINANPANINSPEIAKLEAKLQRIEDENYLNDIDIGNRKIQPGNRLSGGDSEGVFTDKINKLMAIRDKLSSGEPVKLKKKSDLKPTDAYNAKKREQIRSVHNGNPEKQILDFINNYNHKKESVNSGELFEALLSLPVNANVDVMYNNENHIANNTGAIVPMAGKIVEDGENEVVINNTLNEKLFDLDTEKLKPEIREGMLAIANDFLKDLDFNFDLEDVYFTGSCANYNYNNASDIDIHLVFNYERVGISAEILTKYFIAKKKVYNSNHDISIKGYPVEVGVEDINTPLVSSGVYSLRENDWVKKPNKDTFDGAEINSEDWQKWTQDIEDTIESKDSEKILEKWKEIGKYRREGLAKDGETSSNNLIFKKLRADGYLERLRDAYYNACDKELSIESLENFDEE